MKLISCHIVNFGALANYDITFNDGLTALYAPNGGGKSTLAAFIKAMFYGLSADSSRSRFNERRHYYPFSGGKFGGNILFEWRGSTYRAERFFDRTSGDDIKVYRDGAPYNGFQGGAVGLAVFGLDEQSFVNTLFISGGGGSLQATGGITSLLSREQPSDGQYDLTAALTALDRACKNLQSRGGKGKIAELEESVRRCQTDIANIRAVSDRLEEKYAECSALERRLKEAEGEEERAGTAALTAEKWARYDDMCGAIARRRERLSQLDKMFAAGLPSDDELGVLNAAAGADALSAPAPARPAGGKKPSAGIVALSFALSLAMIVCGAVLLPIKALAGALALGAGVVFALATVGILFVGKPRRRTGQSTAARSELYHRADDIIKKYNLTSTGYAQAAAELSRAVTERQTVADELARAEGEAKAYAAANALTVRPAETSATRRDSDELRRRLAAINRDISDDESIVEGLGERQAALAGAERRLAECRRKYADYTAAAHFLKEAERSLNRGLVGPVKEAFSRYSALLKNTLGESVYVDGNFSVAFEGGGELRPVGHLSGGQRAVVSLCYRLALIDNLFGSDLPFVLLDDPFAELDGEHMARAAQLLRELSKGRQMIYLYCHDSRRV